MPAPRLEKLMIRNYKSIGAEAVKVSFPSDGPLVIIGENNAGKSNITRGLDLLFGERWPGTYEPEDHDFHMRERHAVEIELGATTSGLPCSCGYGEINYLRWKYDVDRDPEPCAFSRECSSLSCNRTFLSREIRSQLFSMYIGANRDLTYQLSYRSKFTLLSKLMHRFHETLTSDEHRVAGLKRIFADIMSQFDDVDEFKEFREILGDISEQLGQGLSYRLDIDFSAYDPSNFFRSLRVHPHFDGEARSFDELGTGQTQILAMSFAYAYAKAFGRQDGLILVIDEPESHLHPLAQQWLASRLSRLVTDGLQVVVTTHSPNFIDLAHPENLVLVQRKDVTAGSTVRQVSTPTLVSKLVQRGAPVERTTEKSVGAFYSSVATEEILSGFFAKSCVLVEGRTEAFALPELLRFVGFDPLRYGVAFVSVDGISNIAKWRRLLDVYGIPVYLIFDSDADKKGKEAATARAARIDIISALGRDEAEADVEFSQPLIVHEEYAVLHANFEMAARALIGERWDTLTEEAREVVGSSKPLIARYVARRLDFSEIPESVRDLLNYLAQAIRGDDDEGLGKLADEDPQEF